MNVPYFCYCGITKLDAFCPVTCSCNTSTRVSYYHFYLIFYSKKPLDSVSLFDWKESAWRKLAPMVTSRAYPCGVTDKSRARLVVAGGFNNKELNSVEVFDIKTEKWLKAPSMPTARTKCGGAIVGDYFAVVS